MSHIVLANCRIKGNRPHIQHMFSPDSIPLEKQEKTGVAGRDPEEWKRTCQITPDREMFCTPMQLFGLFVAKNGGAAKHIKKGRMGSILSDMASTLQIIDDVVKLTRDGEPIILPEIPVEILEAEMGTKELPDDGFVLVSNVVNPSTKARNVRYRAACKAGWEVSFSCLFDKTIVSRPQFELCLDAAAKLVGLSNSRAIGYGRFDVVSLEFSES